MKFFRTLMNPHDLALTSTRIIGGPGGIELSLESHINRVFYIFEMIKLPEKYPNFALAVTGR